MKYFDHRVANATAGSLFVANLMPYAFDARTDIQLQIARRQLRRRRRCRHHLDRQCMRISLCGAVPRQAASDMRKRRGYDSRFSTGCIVESWSLMSRCELELHDRQPTVTVRSFNHRVGDGEHAGRNLNIERPCGLQVDDEFETCPATGPADRRVLRISALVP